MLKRKIWLTLLLCLLLCACLLPAAYADGLNDLQSAVNGHAAEFTLTENTAIPANTTIDASGTKIIVPLGKTLTVNGKLTVDDFNIEQNPQLNQRGVLSIPEGGELHVKGWHNLSNNIWTNWRRTGETGRISFADGAGFYLMRGGITDADGIGYAIRDASDTQYNDIAENDHLRLYAIASGFNWVLAEDTTIPEHLILDIQDCGLSVPLGKTLTVAGKLIVDDFSIEQNPQANQRGVLSIPESGELHVKGWHNLSNNIWTNWRGTGETGRISFDDDAGFYLMRGIIDAEGIGYAIRDAGDTQYNDIAENDHLRLHAIASGFDWVLAEDTTIPEHLILDIQDCGLSVPLGKTLTVAGKLIVDDFNIEQNPQLNQRGVLSIPEGGELHVKGWHDLSNNIWTNWHGTGETGRISFVDDAGFILHRGDIGADGQGHSATDVFQFTLEDGNRILTEAPGHLKFDFGLRAGETVNMSGETLTIPAGFILTINGPLFTDGLLVNGSVTIGENAFVLVKEEFGVGQSVGEGMFTLNGTLSIKNTALSDPTQLEVVANNGMLDIYFEMFDADALLPELNAPTGNFGDHFRRSLWVLFPWELSNDLTLPGHVHLCVSSQGSDQGNLTIPEGVLLTIPETGQLFTGGDEGETVVQLNGGLVNNGELAIGDEMGYDPGEIAFGPKGFYAGFGTVTRLGRSDQILNDRTHADLLLPADLTKIESEALAGGVFDSVFIPDGTTSIADDAFGGREIVIFGELESFAETYARGKGYCFAPVA